MSRGCVRLRRNVDVTPGRRVAEVRRMHDASMTRAVAALALAALVALGPTRAQGQEPAGPEAAPPTVVAAPPPPPYPYPDPLAFAPPPPRPGPPPDPPGPAMRNVGIALALLGVAVVGIGSAVALDVGESGGDEIAAALIGTSAGSIGGAMHITGVVLWIVGANRYGDGPSAKLDF